jgi:hypothetical protein
VYVLDALLYENTRKTGFGVCLRTLEAFEVKSFLSDALFLRGEYSSDLGTTVIALSTLIQCDYDDYSALPQKFVCDLISVCIWP